MAGYSGELAEDNAVVIGSDCLRLSLHIDGINMYIHPILGKTLLSCTDQL